LLLDVCAVIARTLLQKKEIFAKRLICYLEDKFAKSGTTHNGAMFESAFLLTTHSGKENLTGVYFGKKIFKVN